MPRIRRLLFVATVTLLCGCSQHTVASAGILQVLEVRDGHRGVWGIEIVLRDSAFPASLSPGQLHVIEQKHLTDITNMMDCSVSADRSRLIIRFKQGMGDFGTGNTVTITIARTALLRYDQPNEPEWTISTDPM